MTRLEREYMLLLLEELTPNRLTYFMSAIERYIPYKRLVCLEVQANEIKELKDSMDRRLERRRSK